MNTNNKTEKHTPDKLPKEHKTAKQASSPVTPQVQVPDDNSSSAPVGKENFSAMRKRKAPGKIFCKICGVELKHDFLRQFPENDICISRRCYYSNLARTNNTYASLIAHIPKRYRQAEKNNFKAETFSSLEAELKASSSIFLTGSQGIGKTHLAAALCNNALADFASVNGYDLIWRRSTDLILELQDSFSSAVINTREILSRFKRCGLLILDDFGAEKITEWSISAVYSILAERVDELRPTIVTSNLNLDEIDSFEPRIASRLAEFATTRLPQFDRRVQRRSN